jgi:hypothetical protein
VLLLIDGQWTAAADGRTLPVRNPATGEVIGAVAHAGIADLDQGHRRRRARLRRLAPNPGGAAQPNSDQGGGPLCASAFPTSPCR